MPVGGLVRQVRGNLADLVLRAERLILPEDAAHLDQVDHALQAVFRADRELDGNGIGLQSIHHRLHGVIEIGADSIHLVDECQPRHLVLVGLAPDRLRLRLHAGHGVEQRDGAVKDAQRALDLGREIDMPGRVDDVDLVVPPETGRRGRGDRDAALLLLLHVVHGRGAVVHLAHAVQAPGVVQDALRGRGLAGVNVRGNADVAVALDWDGAGHRNSL